MNKYINSKISKCFIEQYMFEFCTDLAKSLHIKTNLPIYGVINDLDRNNSEYDHYFIGINDIYLIDICGIHTMEDIKIRWSKIFNTSIDNVCIEKTNLDDENIGDYENTNKISNYLINEYQLSYTQKYKMIRNIIENSFLNINISMIELLKLIDKNNGYKENDHDNNNDQNKFMEL